MAMKEVSDKVTVVKKETFTQQMNGRNRLEKIVLLDIFNSIQYIKKK